MRSAVVAKSLTDLTRRKTRTVLAVASLSLAVASVGVFAVEPLMDDAMQEEVASTRLADLTVEMKPLPLDRADLAALERIPNVAALEPRSVFATRVYAGERREDALLVGVRDYADQRVNVVHLVSGAAPEGGRAVLTEHSNAQTGRFEGKPGEAASVVAADGSTERVRITGEGRNVDFAQEVTFEETVVLYTTPETVERIGGRRGVSALEFRLADPSPAAAERTLAAVQDRLEEREPGFTGFAELPEVREPGEWPGKEEFQDFSSLFYIVTVLALLSGLVLIGSTMSTMIAEQTGEIATMRAIGGGRRDMLAIYLRTAVLLGALGALVGVPLGILLANGMLAFFASAFYGIDTSFGVNVGWAAVSAVLGLVGPALAALPGIRRGLRMPVREALERRALSGAPVGRVERALARVRFVPRNAQIGLRSVGRRRRRSISTALMVALAVGNLLGVMALAKGTTDVTRSAWDDRDWDITVGSNLRRPLDPRAERIIRDVPGVEGIERAFINDIQVGGRDAIVYGLGVETHFRYKLEEGRWHTPADEADAARVAVLESGMADADGIEVGDSVEFATGTGPAEFRIIGIASNIQENGKVAFIPLATAREVLGSPDGVNFMWVTTTSDDHGLIDRATTRIEDELTASGYEVGTEIQYVGERDNVEQNKVLTSSIAVLGFLVVAISMVGLVNSMTTSVLERTREIGIMRCVGARARDVRRIFGTEGLTLAAAGWLVGIPLGYLIDRAFVWLVRELLEIEIPVVYPLSHVAIALAGTLVLAVAVIGFPLRRAVRFKPGDALRYA